MDEIDGGDFESPVKGKQGDKRRKLNQARDKLVLVPMPVICPEADPNCQETRTISLYVEKRQQTWLSIADVDWAVQYLYAQFKLKGVESVSPQSAAPSAGGE